MIPHRRLHQPQLNRPQSQVQKQRNKLLEHRRVLPASLWHVRMWQTRPQKKKRKAGRSQQPRMNGEAGEFQRARLEVGCNGFTTSTTNSLREVRNSWSGIIAGFKGSYSRLQKRAAALNGEKQTTVQKEEVITDLFGCYLLSARTARSYWPTFCHHHQKQT